MGTNRLHDLLRPSGAHLQCSRSLAVVNLDAIAANVASLVNVAGPAVRIMAVVKANAYGHGAVPVAITALRAGAAALAVACIDEGVQLRQAGLTAPILVLGATAPHDLVRVVTHRLTPTICDRPTAEALCATVASLRAAPAPIHVKVDTGLHRFGIAASDAVDFARWVHEQPGLRLEGLYTHFSSAEDADGTATAREYGRFVAVVEQLRRQGITPSLHASNSAASMRYPQLRLDMVRPGYALYGLASEYQHSGKLLQQPALAIYGRINRVFTIAPGEAVGYGRTYVAKEPRRAALVGVGYGDGLPRALSNRGAMLVNGKRAPILGRISMDQTVVDITEAGDVEPGDCAVVLGRQGDDEITAAEIAAWAGTIAYEIVVGLAPRLPRLYMLGNRAIGMTSLLGDHQLVPGAGTSIFHWTDARLAEAASAS